MRGKILVGIILIMATQLFGFGAFNSFNNRNHAELEWLEMESENIRLIYHDPLQDWALESINIAEATFAALEKSYSNKPEGKIPFYISDQDDIANGATVFDSYIFIYVNQSEYLQNFSGKDNFLRKVISHEMSHYFLFSTVSDWITKAFPIKTAMGFPHDINEGFAQFFSGEEWGMNRGDNSLRNAVYTDNDLLEPNETSSGGLLYARGFAIVRYLAAFYGEDSLRELLNYRNNGKIFSFAEAFQKTYDKSFSEFQQDWEQYINTQYYGQAYQHKLIAGGNESFDDTFSAFHKISNPMSSLNQIVLSDSTALILGKKYEKQQYRNLLLANIKADSLAKNKLIINDEQEIAKGGYFFNLALSADGSKAVYNSYSRHAHGSLLPTIHSFDSKTGKTKRVFAGDFPQITNKGKIYFKTRDLTRSYLNVWDGILQTKLLTFEKDIMFEKITLSPDETKLAISYLGDRVYGVRIYELETMKMIFEEEYESFAQNLIWNNTNQLVTVSGDSAEYTTQYRIIDLLENSAQTFYAPVYNLYPVATKLQNDSLTVIGQADLSSDSMQLGRVTFTGATKADEFSENHYNIWQKIEYENKIEYDPNVYPEILSEGKYNSLKAIKMRMTAAIPTDRGVVIGALASEPLGLHMFYGGAWVPYNFDNKFFYAVGYINRSFAPTISLNSYQIDMVAGYYDDEFYLQNIRITDLAFNYPLDWISASFWNQSISAGLSYQDVKAVKNKTYTYTDQSGNYLYEKGSSLLASAGYGLLYNLPYLNSRVHPVRKLELNYSVTAASEEFAMNSEFVNQTAKLELAFAPLYSLTKSSMLQSFAFDTQVYWEKQNGTFLNQFSPGIDKDEIFLNGDSPLFHRTNLRGYETTLIGDEVLTIKNEIRLKLADDMKFGINWNNPLVAVSYLGVAGWFDHNKFKTGSYEAENNAMGYELKANVSALGLPIEVRYGEAWNMDQEKLGDYLQLSLSFGIPGI